MKVMKSPGVADSDAPAMLRSYDEGLGLPQVQEPDGDWIALI
jgi:hypothetical protein